jgi:ADP-dependent NAD(P)H-hydrate dehydratase / NAD(P)H-hydrate epimerase
MIITPQAMRAAEASAIQKGRTQDSLMEEAGASLAALLAQFFPTGAALVIFAGKGHTAGDAFVAARHLLEVGWSVTVRLAHPEADLKPLTRAQWKQLSGKRQETIPIGRKLVILDALLGLGARGALQEPIKSLATRLNTLRAARGATTVAIDAPTGVDLETGAVDENAVIADITVSIAAAKIGLFAPAALSHVGRLAVARVKDLDPVAVQDPEVKVESSDQLITPRSLRASWPTPTPYDMSKGQAGRVGILAGSRGLVGAACLCAAGALRGGAGLVTLFVPEAIYEIAAASCTPEVMVRPVRDYEEIWRFPADVLAIGPGLGPITDHSRELLNFILTDPRPAVLDADALNLLANKHTGILAKAKAPRLVTPHPGEMRRLLESWKPDLQSRPRAEIARTFSATFPATLLFKGSRTLVSAPGRALSHNSTGHPGMATGGLGDVLTGLCAALIARGHDTYGAACAGSWLLGRASELAVSRGAASPETLSAGDVLAHLGAAFTALWTDADDTAPGTLL